MAVAPWTDEEGLLLTCVFSGLHVVREDLWRKVYRVLLAKQ
jgi:hypothetical protein